MVIQGLGFGGMEKLVYEMVRYIYDKKFDLDIDICCYDFLGFFASKLKKEIRKVNIFYLKRRQGIDFLYPVKLAFLIKKRKIDIIHAHNATAWFYGVWASMLSRVPLVYTEHDRSFPTPLRLRYLHYFFGKYTHAIVAVSNAVKQNLEKYEYIRNVQVIYNGIDPELFFPPSLEEKRVMKQNLGLQSDDFVLGNIGRMDRFKNQKILVELFPLLLQKIPQAKLVLVGSGEEEEKLKRLTFNLNLSDKILFLGHRGDINLILKAFDLFVFPSLTEGLPLAIIEAMATGLPIISSPVGGIPELVKNNINGFLVDPLNKFQIISSIVEIFNNFVLRSKMEINSRRFFESEFSLPTMINKYLETYKKITVG